jgi:DNA processing protein
MLLPVNPMVPLSEPGPVLVPEPPGLEFVSRLATIVAPNAIGTARHILRSGPGARREHLESLSDDSRRVVNDLAKRLLTQEIRILIEEDEEWPGQLDRLPNAPAYLFARGNLELLRSPAIGMCGSRRASERGLSAARVCGETVAAHGWHVVSGYAKGVDTETHLAALRVGGNTVIVLAEGILHFRQKRAFDRLPFNSRTVLILSQFPPMQRWTAGAAMTRNGLIVTLGGALVVIEAGETGGTLAAGAQALKLRQPVFALEFSDGPRRGNEALIDAGARALRSRRELEIALDELTAVRLDQHAANPMRRDVSDEAINITL